jgi:hypothetical protein
VRAISGVGRLAVIGAVGFEVAGVWSPNLAKLATASKYIAVISFAGVTIPGLWHTPDLGRRLGLRLVQRSAKHGKIVASIVVPAVVVFALIHAYYTPSSQRVAVVAPIYFGLAATALVGSLWLFGFVADQAAKMRRVCAAMYEQRSGRAHWSSHALLRFLAVRVGRLLQR